MMEIASGRNERPRNDMTLFHVEKEMDVRIHVLVPGRQVHPLIGRVDVVIGQAAADESRLNAADILQHGDHANRSAFATIERRFAPDGFHRRSQARTPAVLMSVIAHGLSCRDFTSQVTVLGAFCSMYLTSCL